MQEKIAKILAEAKERINEATKTEDLEKVRIAILGKKGQITDIFKAMSKLSKDEKKQIGPAANKARTEIEESINKKLSELKELAKQAMANSTNIYEYGCKSWYNSINRNSCTSSYIWRI